MNKTLCVRKETRVKESEKPLKKVNSRALEVADGAGLVASSLIFTADMSGINYLTLSTKAEQGTSHIKSPILTVFFISV